MLYLTVASSVVASSALIAAAPAHAVEVHPATGTVVTLAGHGYGNGTGMSQWGAYGAAAVGKLSWQAILAFYYPGTRLKDLGNPTIRVRLDAVGTGTLYVINSAGLRLAGRALPGPATGVTQYRTHSSSTRGRVQVDARSSAGWKSYAVSASPAVFSSSTGAVDVKLANGSPRAYRGSIDANWATPTSLTTVSVLPMDSYLRAVVPAEMPGSWPANALRAQAVAARSYATYERAHARAGRTWDICDTTSCQMYSGVPAEQGTSDAAVAATAGQTLTYQGSAAFTQFGAADGGWTAAGSQPYLQARADPYDGDIPNNANSWTAGVSAASIQAQWPSIGTYRGLRIISRDGHGQWGGRVLSAAIDGSKSSVTVTGATIGYVFGLQSDWFTPITAAAPSPATTRYTPYKGIVLEQGSTGPAVVALQTGLKVTTDGDFGPITRAALVAFQKRQNLVANGIVTRVVWNRLETQDYPLIAYRSLTLKQGSTGAVVVILQRALRMKPTGVFGSTTTAAVKAIQARAKLSQTGVVSGWTWVAIETWMPR